MLDEEKTKIYEKIDKEYREFTDKVLKMTPEQIYDLHHTICFYEDFYDYINSQQINIDLSYLPKENIFQTIYQLLLDDENYVLSWDNYERIVKNNAEQVEISK